MLRTPIHPVLDAMEDVPPEVLLETSFCQYGVSHNQFQFLDRHHYILRQLRTHRHISLDDLCASARNSHLVSEN